MKKELVLMSMEDKLAILMLNNVPNNLLNDKFLDAIERKLILSKNDNNKKPSSKLIIFNEKKNRKDSYDF